MSTILFSNTVSLAKNNTKIKPCNIIQHIYGEFCFFFSYILTVGFVTITVKRGSYMYIFFIKYKYGILKWTMDLIVMVEI